MATTPVQTVLLFNILSFVFSVTELLYLDDDIDKRSQRNAAFQKKVDVHPPIPDAYRCACKHFYVINQIQ
jgi:hypothetical protein|tara:strand:- start:33 stop:242 length:210 start_codon:yes stop_codon:yes gene_type:complete